jgi:hypothetical protein
MLDLMKMSAGGREVDPSQTNFLPVPNKIAQPTTEKSLRVKTTKPQ